MSSPQLQLCIISDGKAGHDTQLRGLQSGLARHFQVVSERIETKQGFIHCLHALKRWSHRHCHQARLVAGAGSRSWRYLVWAKKILGIHTVVLQKPRLWPYRWFDQIVVPLHDGVIQKGHIICTEGVLNPIQPAVAPKSERGLFLIGGPSKHYDWDEQSLLEQVTFIANDTNNRQWHLTTSRRTPPGFLSKLLSLKLPNLTVIPVDETPANWVGEQLQENVTAWVTEDSMSMVFEGLSAGIQVGLLALPRRREGRVTGSIDNLIQRGWVTPFSQYQNTHKLAPAVSPLQEANRVADILAPTLKAKYLNVS